MKKIAKKQENSEDKGLPKLSNTDSDSKFYLTNMNVNNSFCACKRF